MAAINADQTVRRFVASWERGDVDEVLDFFTEDAVWHPMPYKNPAVGKPALRQAISEWLRGTEQLGVVIHVQISDGKIVMHERTDRFILKGQEHAMPIAAVFEIENGRIAAWREYFDMSQIAWTSPES
jgi:limonene-1,2-epoxide hydrolase